MSPIHNPFWFPQPKQRRMKARAPMPNSMEMNGVKAEKLPELPANGEPPPVQPRPR